MPRDHWAMFDALRQRFRRQPAFDEQRAFERFVAGMKTEITPITASLQRRSRA